MYNAKNYTEQGGDITHIGGKLVFDDGGKFAGGLVPNQQQETPGSDTVAKVRTSLNALIAKLKNAGLMIGDAWKEQGAQWNPQQYLDSVVIGGSKFDVAVTGGETAPAQAEGDAVTLAAGDATEATALGLSAGDFVLYIKADDPEYLLGAKFFKLWASSYEETEFRMKIVETKAD